MTHIPGPIRPCPCVLGGHGDGSPALVTTQSFLLMFWMNSFQHALAGHLLAAKSWDSELKALPACLRAEWDPASPALF